MFQHWIWSVCIENDTVLISGLRVLSRVRKTLERHFLSVMRSDERLVSDPPCIALHLLKACLSGDVYTADLEFAGYNVTDQAFCAFSLRSCSLPSNPHRFVTALYPPCRMSHATAARSSHYIVFPHSFPLHGLKESNA